MIQLSRVGWRLLACENGASPDFIIVVVACVASVCCVCCVVVVVFLFWTNVHLLCCAQGRGDAAHNTDRHPSRVDHMQVSEPQSKRPTPASAAFS